MKDGKQGRQKMISQDGQDCTRKGVGYRHPLLRQVESTTKLPYSLGGNVTDLSAMHPEDFETHVACTDGVMDGF